MSNSPLYIAEFTTHTGALRYINYYEPNRRKLKEPFVTLGLFRERAYGFAKRDVAEEEAVKRFNERKDVFSKYEIIEI